MAQNLIFLFFEVINTKLKVSCALTLARLNKIFKNPNSFAIFNCLEHSPCQMIAYIYNDPKVNNFLSLNYSIRHYNFITTRRSN